MRTGLLAFLFCLHVTRFLDLYVINKANLVCLRTFQKNEQTLFISVVFIILLLFVYFLKKNYYYFIFISIFTWLQKSG